VRQPDGKTVSEVEYDFTENLEQVNGRAPAGGKLPSRVLVRVTQNADGTLASVESLSGESQGLVEALTQKTLIAVGESEAGGAAGAAAAGGKGLALLFRGLKIGGTAAFAIITAYQLYNATPKQVPRVLASGAAGFAGGAASSYVVCNLIFGIETAGWSLLFCGLAAGGLGGYASSKATEKVYDDATASDLDKALHRLEGKGKNEIAIFNMLVGKMGSDVCLNAEFVQSFMAAFPLNLTDTEAILMAAQLSDAAIQPAPHALPAPKQKPALSLGGEAVCPACHGRSSKELLPPSNMSAEQLRALDSIPTCDAVLKSALDALQKFLKNLPPRTHASMTHTAYDPPLPRKPGSNEHATPPGVVLPQPTPNTFPTEAEQLGTKCPNCHAETGGKDLLKEFNGIGTEPNGGLTDADRKRLLEFANSK